MDVFLFKHLYADFQPRKSQFQTLALGYLVGQY